MPQSDEEQAAEELQQAVSKALEQYPIVYDDATLNRIKTLLRKRLAEAAPNDPIRIGKPKINAATGEVRYPIVMSRDMAKRMGFI